MVTYNDPIFKERRRFLRRDQTEAEKRLWQCLRNRKLNGYKFFRQYSVGPYILDFFCTQPRLAIELDGHHHAERTIKEYDEERALYLESLDIRTLRFWNGEVLSNVEAVVEEIKNMITLSSPPS